MGYGLTSTHTITIVKSCKMRFNLINISIMAVKADVRTKFLAYEIKLTI